MAAAHASSLPSVGAAVAALRKAHAAVQNLAAAQAPQRQASEQPWTSEVDPQYALAAVWHQHLYMRWPLQAEHFPSELAETLSVAPDTSMNSVSLPRPSDRAVLSQVIEGLLISPDSKHCLVLFHTRGRQGEMKYGAAVHSLASGKRLSMLSQVSSCQPKCG